MEQRQNVSFANKQGLNFIKGLRWLLVRGLAVIIDNILITTGTILVLMLVSWILKLELGDALIMNSAFLFYAIYYVYMLGKYGQTIGKKICRIVVRNDDGSPISYKKAFFRFIATLLSSATFMLGYVLVFFNLQRKALHDYIVNTVVVRVDV